MVTEILKIVNFIDSKCLAGFQKENEASICGCPRG